MLRSSMEMAQIVVRHIYQFYFRNIGESKKIVNIPENELPPKFLHNIHKYSIMRNCKSLVFKKI